MSIERGLYLDIHRRSNAMCGKLEHLDDLLFRDVKPLAISSIVAPASRFWNTA